MGQRKPRRKLRKMPLNRPLLIAALGMLKTGGRGFKLRMDGYEARPGHVICKAGVITCSPYATVGALAQALEILAEERRPNRRSAQAVA